MPRRTGLIAALALAVMAGVTPAWAQLDDSFGEGGVVAFGSEEDWYSAYGLALDAMGRTWIVGQKSGKPWVAVLDRSGALVREVDLRQIKSRVSVVYDIAVLSDGDVILAGQGAGQDGNEPVLAGLTADGAIDDDFGTGGVLGPFDVPDIGGAPSLVVTDDRLLAVVDLGLRSGTMVVAATHDGRLAEDWLVGGLLVAYGETFDSFRPEGVWVSDRGEPRLVLRTGQWPDEATTIMALGPDGLSPIANVPTRTGESEVMLLGSQDDGTAVLGAFSYATTTRLRLLAVGSDATVYQLGNDPILPEDTRAPLRTEPLRTGGFALVSRFDGADGPRLEVVAFDTEGRGARLVEGADAGPTWIEATASVADADTGALTIATTPIRGSADEETPVEIIRYITDDHGRYVDDDRSVHQADIEAIEEMGITRGCATARFCPDTPVTRGQMASFLVRALSLPAGDDRPFADTAGSIHAADIAALAAAGITTGCAPDRYCPDDPVTRAQMAGFLVRAFELEPSQDTQFTDTTGSVHAADIAALAQAGITRGCTTTEYCPDDPVTRAQMASFLVRALAQAS